MPANKPAPGGQPKYPFPWITIYLLTGLVLIVGAFAGTHFINRHGSKFDYNDPDMQFLENIVLSANPRRGDFTNLNDGNWRALCLAGARGELGKALGKAGIGEPDARALRATHATSAKDMGGTAFVLVYVDAKGTAKAVQHPHGFAFVRADGAACTTWKEPVMALPAGE